MLEVKYSFRNSRIMIRGSPVAPYVVWTHVAVVTGITVVTDGITGPVVATAGDREGTAAGCVVKGVTDGTAAGVAAVALPGEGEVTHPLQTTSPARSTALIHRETFSFMIQ